MGKRSRKNHRRGASHKASKRPASLTVPTDSEPEVVEPLTPATEAKRLQESIDQEIKPQIVPSSPVLTFTSASPVTPKQQAVNRRLSFDENLKTPSPPPAKVMILPNRVQFLRSQSVATPKIDRPIRYTKKQIPNTPSPRKRSFRKRALTIDTGVLANRNSHTPTANRRHPQRQFSVKGLKVTKKGIQEIPEIHGRQIPLSTLDQSMQSLKEFQVIRELGNGRSSRVFLVENTRTKKKYAKKTIYMTADSPDTVIFSEITTLLHLADCPHVINFHQAFYDGFCVHLILEYAHCGSLLQVLKRHSIIPPLTRQAVFYMTMKSLAALHDRNICHNDVKPGNILMTKDGRIKFCDFGLSQYFKPDEKQTDGMAFGTSIFMAPECESSDSYYSFKRDVWSLGISFLYILLGSQQFKNLLLQEGRVSYFYLMAQIHRVKKKELPLICTGDSVLQDLIERCLEVEQEKRPSSQLLINHPFFFMANSYGATQLLDSGICREIAH